jgi:phosphatidylethanolamine-binding protein (PEBP) family uncharacterized protein
MTLSRSLSAAALLAATVLPAHGFELRGVGFDEDGRLPEAAVLDGFGCTGPNRSPALEWTSPPPGTGSLALTMYDLDAPTGSGFWHWIVLGLPPAAGGLAEDAGNAARRRCRRGR